MNEAPRPSIEDLFHGASDLAPEQREAWLAERCGGDGELKERVLALLQQDAGGTRGVLTGDASRFLDSQALKIGRYTIVRELGSGGMGTVFLAQQDEPIQRLVAIKRIRSDVDSEQIVQRFDVERQTLALMTHPCIAQIHDAGTTNDGHPFFAMEYVEGHTLTRYCDERKLDWRRRMELFCRICSAVHHAHQKGVVHRDLKPGNVLVSEASGSPLPAAVASA
jgi:serine/threonine protein kinase